MQANTGRDTKPELALRRAVHARGLRYFVNRRPIKAVRRTADLLFPRLRLAVFLDGCFWHGCPRHHTISKTNAAFWAEKVATNRQRDTNTNLRLADAGWTVLRIWEHEAIEEAADKVAETVTTLRHASPRSDDPPAS
ncbi:very short patch repair endonuclease [Actinoplanes couchii]|uniref:Very short patch repair endonuclease n=3 Tax=Actinoplanes couchii TaxID=403638 RepID=A0ABQ3XIB1_9ACTN|nr:very short patch repair endonuclease [Actinoplanes couchii]